jgi:PAS domain S-box-containing protein
MIYHKTLLRQIIKTIGSVEAISPEYANLLKVINDTYINFDDDRLLIDRSIEISSRELSEYVSLLKSTIESTSDAILVLDNNDKTNIYNEKFSLMLGIPNDVIYSRDNKEMFNQAILQIKDPKMFTDKIKELHDKPDAESYDIFEFKDGRVFERYSKPQKIEGKIVGRVWSYRDITERKNIENKLKDEYEEISKINKFMIDRELRIIELKKEIEMLKLKLENKS